MEEIAKRVFSIETASLKEVAQAIDGQFTGAVKTILHTSGKVILSGVGKSGIIAQKIAATFTSTGTPAFFLHPGEAFHGDLGMVGKQDVVILLSYSGETDEVLQIIPFLNWNQNTIISITGNPVSTLANNSRYHLNIKVTEEACPLKLAPTSSTTAALVMGDALAVALMEARGFQSEDFARFHPGGTLGHKLLVKVKEVMRSTGLPFINEDADFTTMLLRMSEGKLGLAIVGSSKSVSGIVTDGDLRRALLKNADPAKLNVTDVMTTKPVIVAGDEYLHTAEELMISKKITTLLIGSPAERTVVGVYQIYNAYQTVL